MISVLVMVASMLTFEISDLIITEVAFPKMTQGDAARRFAASNPGVVNTADLNLQILGFAFRQRFLKLHPKNFPLPKLLKPSILKCFKKMSCLMLQI